MFIGTPEYGYNVHHRLEGGGVNAPHHLSLQPYTWTLRLYIDSDPPPAFIGLSWRKKYESFPLYTV